MKKLFSIMLGAIVFTIFASASAKAEEAFGVIYKNTIQPGGGSGSVSAAKTGTAVCKSYFGLVATGDCSIKTAMINGKINNLSHYDEAVKNILGYKKITVKAYGQ